MNPTGLREMIRAAPDTGSAHRIQTRNVCARAQGLFGVKVFDVQDPAHPQLAETLSTGGVALAVEIAGSTLYVGDMDRKVTVLSLADSSPERLGEVPLSGTPVAMRVYGSTLLVGEVGLVSGLKCMAGISCWPPKTVEVFDVSHPDSPVHEGDFSFAEARLLFAGLSSDLFITRDAGGVSILSAEVQP